MEPPVIFLSTDEARVKGKQEGDFLGKAWTRLLKQQG